MRGKTPKNFRHFLPLFIDLLILVIIIKIVVSTAYAKKDINACELLTLEDVQSTISEKVKKRSGFPKNMKLAGGGIINSRCYYDAMSSDRMFGLNITFRPNASYPKTLKEYIEVSKDEMGSNKKALKNAKPVQGVGDLAVWTKSWGVGSLNVYWKDYKIIILTGTTENDFEAAKSIAHKILKKL